MKVYASQAMWWVALSCLWESTISIGAEGVSAGANTFVWINSILDIVQWLCCLEEEFSLCTGPTLLLYIWCPLQQSNFCWFKKTCRKCDNQPANMPGNWALQLLGSHSCNSEHQDMLNKMLNSQPHAWCTQEWIYTPLQQQRKLTGGIHGDKEQVGKWRNTVYSLTKIMMTMKWSRLKGNYLPLPWQRLTTQCMHDRLQGDDMVYDDGQTMIKLSLTVRDYVIPS